MAKRKKVDTGWVTLTGDSQWKDGETLTGVFQGIEKPKGKKIKGRLLTFQRNGEIVKRWSASILDRMIDSGEIKKGQMVRITAHPIRKGGRGKIRPFDVAVKR